MKFYHATYRNNLQSILKEGLNPEIKEHNWKGYYVDNLIFLAFDPYTAIDFAKTADNYNKQEVVVLEIDSKDINLNDLRYDWNVKCRTVRDINTIAYANRITKFKVLTSEDVNKARVVYDEDFKDVTDYLFNYFEEHVITDDKDAE